MMDRQELATKLAELRGKHERVKSAWEKVGNKELLQFFVELIPRALNAERCSIFIVDPVADNVWLQCGTGLNEKALCVPKDSSLVGRVISTGQCIIEHDMENQVGAHEMVALQTGFHVRDTICVPVHGVTTDKVTGAIQVLNKKTRESFTADDRKILERLAFHLQMQIENIFLRQELAKIAVEMGKQIKALESRLKALGAQV